MRQEKRCRYAKGRESVENIAFDPVLIRCSRFHSISYRSRFIASERFPKVCGMPEASYGN